MDKFWLYKAREYLTKHNAFKNVSDISISNGRKTALISAIVSVNLPGKYIETGITDIGVKSDEKVKFIFPESFPLDAPKILLRNDFPRCFPHINPSKERVIPCIYEGDLSEFLQQSEWMNGILNQLVDWLEKAASNDLLSYDQGWEPMRNDNTAGFIPYDTDFVTSRLETNPVLIKEINYEQTDRLILTDSLCINQNPKKAHAIFFMCPKVVDQYMPNTIRELKHLYSYSVAIGIQDAKRMIEQYDLEYINEDILFVVFSVKRPVNLIGTYSNIEFLNFVIYKSEHRKKKKRELKRTLPDSRVRMMSHLSICNPKLFKQLSGTQTKTNEKKYIALLGCGSLGSKIGMHLARNGNEPFLCIDNDIFMPHNNARHALTLTSYEGTT